MARVTEFPDGFTTEHAPDDVIKKTNRDTLFFQRPGSACCHCWQAFGPGETVKVYTFPSGTRQWFHYGCALDWYRMHGGIVQAALAYQRLVMPEPPSDAVVQAAFPDHLLD